ncbi:metal-dependent transcriptional regulator [Lactobacillus sp. 3B(2020)]|uniref:metal-dependent transcriptional regulator n=1 Tax=Lactobacillus sp. 3B(2020) TaxID=2695882 RepID=UPI0015DF7F3D|nr:metal-dependent transcriptional regulator [Lactobacillus sp. 3B(2020)]QLL70665.1 metal-dependent transcriptional regulator [Lactobacillus sp. 3B(2020)]
MTPMKEDYLKIIFELGGMKKQVSNKQISLGLGIAAGSVTEMITKLDEEGLVTHQPYAGIQLTEHGFKVAAELVRKHRLWETFLVDKLGYSVADVHPEAEVLEHETSDRLATALDDFLGHPESCPHGGMIPNAAGEFKNVSHRLLSDAKDGEIITIERFLDNHELLTYLSELGIQLHDRFEVIKHEPFEGPLVVKQLSDQKTISISFKASHNIFINEVKS